MICIIEFDLVKHHPFLRASFFFGMAIRTSTLTLMLDPGSLGPEKQFANRSNRRLLNGESYWLVNLLDAMQFRMASLARCWSFVG